MKIFLFDVDGTLTPACQEIVPEFGAFFREWSEGRNVVLVTGSDVPKTKRQLGELWSQYIVYQCSGNQIYCNGIKVYEEPILRDEGLEISLKQALEKSRYPIKCGDHIELRNGMINFSFVGRACTLEQRRAYYEWDLENEQRKNFVSGLSLLFPRYDIHIGGQISVDIYEKGKSKEQVVKHLLRNGEVVFIGDKTQPGGNDYEIAKHLPAENVFTVSSWEETRELLTSNLGCSS